MLHRDSKSAEAGKHLYKETDILTDDLAYFFRTKEEEKAKHNNDEFFNDLLNGNLSKREMALKYGRDYAKIKYDTTNLPKKLLVKNTLLPYPKTTLTLCTKMV